MSSEPTVKGLNCLNCGTPIPCVCGKNQTDPEQERLLLGRIEVRKAEPEPKLEPVAPPIDEEKPVETLTFEGKSEDGTEEAKLTLERAKGEYDLDKALRETPTKTFSVNPEEFQVGHPDPVPQPEKVEVSVTTSFEPTGTTEISVEEGKIETFVRDPAREIVLFRGRTVAGKPVEMAMSFEMLEKFVLTILPKEEARIQELLDKIHKIRESRGLFVEEIDKGLTQVSKDADKDFKACTNKVDISKTDAAFRAKLAVLTQKRYLAKFSIQEESELSLLLAKLRHDVE